MLEYGATDFLNAVKPTVPLSFFKLFSWPHTHVKAQSLVTANTGRALVAVLGSRRFKARPGTGTHTYTHTCALSREVLDLPQEVGDGFCLLYTADMANLLQSLGYITFFKDRINNHINSRLPYRMSHACLSVVVGLVFFFFKVV